MKRALDAAHAEATLGDVCGGSRGIRPLVSRLGWINGNFW